MKPKKRSIATRSVVAGKVVKTEPKRNPLADRALPQGLPASESIEEEDAKTMEYQFGKKNYNRI